MNRNDKLAEAAAAASLEVSISDIVAIAVEHWRLSTLIATASGNVGTAPHSLRRIADILARWQVEAQSLNGRPFDAGLAARVVDTVDDPFMPKGIDIVDETVSPLVIWRGAVIRSAEIVVRRGTGKKH